jgi:hypothetical protein
MLIKLKHILAFALLGAFMNIWAPADVIIELHSHEHTVHDYEQSGKSFESLHHHCAVWQAFILLPEAEAFIFGKTFLKFLPLNQSFLSALFTIPCLKGTLDRGPPKGLII